MATVVIPWRGGCSHRERAREFVEARYEARFPAWGCVFAGHDGGPWCKARAVTPAVRRAENGAVVVADADVWTDGLESAVRAVTVGAANWAMPHRMVLRLTPESTGTFMSQGCDTGLALDEKPYEGIRGGGIVVAHRDLLLEVPLDPRFEGFGQEDESWGIALETLAGPPWRGTADLWHLWHPPQERRTRHAGSPENWRLRKLYGRAGRNPEAMRKLIEEGAG